MPDTAEAMRAYMQTWVEAQGLMTPQTEAELMALFSMIPAPPVGFGEWCRRMGLDEIAAPMEEQARMAVNDLAASVKPGE